MTFAVAAQAAAWESVVAGTSGRDAVDQRLRYLAAVRAADRGDCDALVRFLRDVVIDTIELVIQALRTTRTAGAMDALATLGGDDEPALDRDQVNFVAARLQTVLRDELRNVASQVPSSLMSVTVAPANTSDGQVPPAVSVTATSPRRAGSAASVAATVHVLPDPGTRWPLEVVAETTHHRPVLAPMKLRLDNLYPALTTITQQRIRQWASQLVNSLAGELVHGRSP